MNRSTFFTQGSLIMCFVLFFGQGMAQSFPGIERAIESEEFQKALKMIDTKLGEEPKNERLYYLKGRAYLAQDARFEARAAFKKGINYGARYPMNYIGLGSVIAREGDFASAKEKFDKANELNKNLDADILIAIANGYLNSDGKDFLAEAERVLYQVKGLEKDNVEAYISLGDLYMKQGVSDLALPNYEEAIKLDPKFLKGYLRVGQLKVKNEEYNDGADAFNKAMEIEPGFAPVYKELGELWYKAGKYEKAKEFYKQYVDLTKNDVSANLRYATFLYLTKNYEEAIPMMEALLPDTNSLVLLRLLGYSYSETNKPQKAMDYMDRYFAQVKPKYILAKDHEYMGNIHHQMGKDSMAIVSYEKAMEVDKERTDLYGKMGEMFYGQKNYEKAAEFYEKYIETGSAKFKQYFFCGMAYYTNKDYPNAEKAFIRISEKYPKTHIPHTFLGRIKSKEDSTGTEGLAKPHYDKVWEMLHAKEKLSKKEKSDLDESARYLGYYFWTHGEDCENAVIYWQKVLEFDPENEGAKDILKYCESK